MIQGVLLLLGLLMGVVFFSLLERKVLSVIQLRKGPNKSFVMGVLQSVFDAVKLFSKEQLFLMNVRYVMYMLNVMGFMLMSILVWMSFPMVWRNFKFDMMLLLIIFLVSLESLFLLFMSWFSSNKYSLIGSMRGVSLLISYEIQLLILVLLVLYFYLNLELDSMVLWQEESNSSFYLYYLLFVVFFISSLSEMNRTPFDLVEGESELVSGFNIEYMAFSLSMIFIGEFSSMLIMMIILSSMFMYGGLGVISFMLSFFLLVIRASFPRMRYDYVMQMYWKVLLPIGMGLFIVYFI